MLENENLRKEKSTNDELPIITDDVKGTLDCQKETIINTDAVATTDVAAILGDATQDANTKAELIEKLERNRQYSVTEKKDQLLTTDLGNGRNSADMLAVKDAKLNLYCRLSKKTDIAGVRKDAKDIEKSLLIAISACDTYISHKETTWKYYDNNRLVMVRNFRKQCYEDLKGLSILKRRDFVDQERTIVDWLDQAAGYRADPVQYLEYKDYINILSSKEGEAIVCIHGRLFRKSSLGPEDTEFLTNENYRMVDHLVDLLLSREDTKSDFIKAKTKRNIMRGLGVNLKSETCGPVDMAKLLRIMKESNSKLSKVDSVLLKGKAADPVELQIAQSIDNLLGSAFSAGKSTRENYENKQKDQLRKIFAYKANRNRVENSGINTVLPGELDFLVAGQLQSVRDRVYDSVMRIYRRKKASGISDEELEKTLKEINYTALLKLALSEVIANVPHTAKRMATNIAEYEEQQILGEKNTALENIKNLRIDYLMADNIENIRILTYSQLKKWKKLTPGEIQNLRRDNPTREGLKKAQAARERARAEKLVCGLNAYCDIADNICKLNDLINKGVARGLTQEEADLMEKYGEQIDSAFGDGDQEALKAFSEKFAENTAIAKGLRKVIGQKNRLCDYKKYAHNVAVALKVDQVLEEKQVKDTEAFGSIFSEEAAAEKAMERLDEKTRAAASIFTGKTKPEDFIKKAGDKNSKGIIGLFYAMNTISTENPKTVKFAGVTMHFSVDKDKILTLTVDKKTIELPYTAEYWRDRFTEVIAENYGKFERISAITVLLNRCVHDSTNLGQGNNFDGTIYRSFIAAQSSVKKEQLENFSAADLRSLMIAILNNESQPEIENAVNAKMREIIGNHEEAVFNYSKEVSDGLLAMEEASRKEQANQIQQNLLVNQNEEKKKPEIDLAIYDNKEEWSQDQLEALDFMGEFIFSNKTWRKYGSTYTVERLLKVIADNAQGFEALVKNADIIEESFKRNIFFKKIAGSIIKFTKDFNEFLNTAGQEEKPIAAKDCAAFENKGYIDKFFAGEKGKNVVSNLNNQVNKVSENISKYMTDAIYDEPVKRDYDTLYSLTSKEIIEKNLSGGEGAGAFNKKVLSNYVEESIDEDKKYMLACALKNAPKYSDKVSYNIFNGRCISGYLKGAGPMLHKLMQGIPMDSLSPVMQEAIKDSKSNLTGLDKNVIKLTYAKLKASSNGQIESITTDTQLGAASVGVTMLVKIKKTGAKQAEEKVVKILRPDIVNRLTREYAKMKKFAREVDQDIWKKKPGNENKKYPTDEIGSFEREMMDKYKTYMEETDFTIEANNIKKGQVYDDLGKNIRAMKMDNTMPKTDSAIVLEKAPGVTVDQYMSDVTEQLKKLKNDDSGRREDSAYSQLRTLSALRKELLKKQGFLINLGSKWVEEALFKSGYFHGDMHAGNIMLDDEGATAIDFGNAHTLTRGERDKIIRLLVAATRGRDDRFKQNYGELLSGVGKDKFKAPANQAKINDIIKSIILKDDDPVSITLAIVSELKNAGFDVPAKLDAFINSLSRITVTLMDYNKLIEQVDDAIKSDFFDEGVESFLQNPTSRIMPTIKAFIYDKKDMAGTGEGIPGINEKIDDVFTNTDFAVDVLYEYYEDDIREEKLCKLFQLGQYEKTIKEIDTCKIIDHSIFGIGFAVASNIRFSIASILGEKVPDKIAIGLFRTADWLWNKSQSLKEVKEQIDKCLKDKEYLDLYLKIKETDPLGFISNFFKDVIIIEHNLSDDKIDKTQAKITSDKWELIIEFLTNNFSKLEELKYKFEHIDKNKIEDIRPFLKDYMDFARNAYVSMAARVDEKEIFSNYYKSAFDYMLYGDNHELNDDFSQFLSNLPSDEELNRKCIQIFDNETDGRVFYKKKEKSNTPKKKDAAKNLKSNINILYKHLDGEESFEDGLKQLLKSNDKVMNLEHFINKWLKDDTLTDDLKKQLREAYNGLKNFYQDNNDNVINPDDEQSKLIQSLVNALKNCIKARATVFGKIAIDSQKVNKSDFSIAFARRKWYIFFHNLEKSALLLYPYWEHEMERSYRYEKKLEYINKKTEQMQTLMKKLVESQYLRYCKDLQDLLNNYNNSAIIDDKKATVEDISKKIDVLMATVIDLIKTGFTRQEAANMRKKIVAFEQNPGAFTLCEIINAVNDKILELFKDTFYTLYENDTQLQEDEKLSEEEDIKENILLRNEINKREKTTLRMMYGNNIFKDIFTIKNFVNLTITRPLDKDKFDDLDEMFNPGAEFKKQLQDNGLEAEFTQKRQNGWCTKKIDPKEEDVKEKKEEKNEDIDTSSKKTNN